MKTISVVLMNEDLADRLNKLFHDLTGTSTKVKSPRGLLFKISTMETEKVSLDILLSVTKHSLTNNSDVVIYDHIIDII